jgi:predicted HTH transcriptional regulator
MTLMSVPIDSITEDHLRSLIENQVMELRVIEYKRELPGRSDGDKKEFLSDVCSFANTAGGDLMYGIAESGGTPQHLVGIDADNVDAEISRQASSIRDGIGPRIPGIQHQPVQLENGKYVLVLRVPRSFARPHVVTYQNHWKFYARTSNGKYQMDVDEVRRAFVLSESVADRIRAFRAERLSQVVSRETPVPVEGTSRVVLHVVPISAFDAPTSFVDLDIR